MKRLASLLVLSCLCTAAGAASFQNGSFDAAMLLLTIAAAFVLGRRAGRI